MRSRTAVALSIITAVVLAGLAAAPAGAQDRFGLRAGAWSDNSDPFVGAELLIPMQAHWFFNPNGEVVFGDNLNTFELSGDFHYDLDRIGSARAWVGVGPAVVIRDYNQGLTHGSSTTDFGVNLLAGVGFPTRSGLVPYVQGKVVISDTSQAVLAVGVRF